MSKDKPNTKKLTFDFYPKDEEAFIKTESLYREYVDKKEPIPTEIGKRFLEILYSKQTMDKEIDTAWKELTTAYLAAVKSEVMRYFKGNRHFDFKTTKDGVDYNLEDWLGKFIEGLKQKAISPKNRNEFINHTVNSLRSYTKDLNNSITKSAIYTVTGYICVMFGQFVHPNRYDATRYKYPTYKAYLRSTIKDYIKE